MKSMNLRSVGGLLKAIFPFLGLVGVIAFFMGRLVERKKWMDRQEER